MSDTNSSSKIIEFPNTSGSKPMVKVHTGPKLYEVENLIVNNILENIFDESKTLNIDSAIKSIIKCTYAIRYYTVETLIEVVKGRINSEKNLNIDVNLKNRLRAVATLKNIQVRFDSNFEDNILLEIEKLKERFTEAFERSQISEGSEEYDINASLNLFEI